MGIRAYEILIAATHRDVMEQQAEVMELRFGLGYKSRVISSMTGLSKSQVNNIIKKYRPKQTGRDIVILISSKI